MNIRRKASVVIIFRCVSNFSRSPQGLIPIKGCFTCSILELDSRIKCSSFIFKAALRIKIKNRQINAAIEKCLSGEKRGTENDETAISRMISYDVRDISDMIEPKHVCCVYFFHCFTTFYNIL